MVNVEGQLYTMEGIAAGLIMILTAYLVLGSTTVYTPGDTHITDMQMEQVGYDILKVMDTPDTQGNMSELERMVYNYEDDEFLAEFWNNYLMSLNIAAQKTTRTGSSILPIATVYYHKEGEEGLHHIRFGNPLIPYTGGQTGVTVTRLVKVPGKGNMRDPDGVEPDPDDRPQVVLLEVFLWKA